MYDSDLPSHMREEETGKTPAEIKNDIDTYRAWKNERPILHQEKLKNDRCGEEIEICIKSGACTYSDICPHYYWDNPKYQEELEARRIQDEIDNPLPLSLSELAWELANRKK